jgi:hypothetical protein
MNRVIIAALIALPLAAMASANANAWERNGSTTGAYGRTFSSQGSGSCANGTCSKQQTVTGPNGQTATRNRAVTCSGGTCNSNATVSTPNGGWKRSSTFSR